MEELTLLETEPDSIVLITSCDERRQLHLVFTDDGESAKTNKAALVTSLSDAKYDLSKSPKDPENMFPVSSIQSSKAVKNLRELRDALNEYFDENTPSRRISINSRTDTTQTATMEEMRRFELFREVITHEDDLLNQRVSWIILAQSFLMAAYITAGEEPDSLRFVTAAVGLATVFVTIPAIYAAGRNVEVQQQVYFRQIETDERCEFLHGHGRDLSLQPNEGEERDRMLFGHLLPNMSFRSRSAVKILWTATLLAVVQLLGWIFLIIAIIYEWE
jgi:hypothetical protein